MEAGNRSFDQRVPEEINRKIIDHTSDINLVFSEHSRRYLLAEGVKPETVIKTGSPMKEVLTFFHDAIEQSKVLDELAVQPGRFLVVSAHREENVDSESNFRDLLASLNAIAQRYQHPVIVSTHPRTRKRLEALGPRESDARIRFLKPLGFLDYVKLQKNAFCAVSDSGTITEESSILGFPAVTIRQAHERPEGMDEATLIMSGLTPERVIESIDLVRAHHHPSKHAFRLLPDYDVDNVSKKVVRIILSYTDYVNRTVWFK
jgi:UDP-N-acetylglucosamine 2-epimerase (non-hydrolysing)